MTPITPLRTVLVANRGEIAVRIMATLARLGIRSVAVYTDADAGAAHVRAADVAVALGPEPRAYLDAAAILAAARAAGADAVHPGYGFLSENASFAAACAEASVVFIGPPAAAIAAMGDKISAKRVAESAGVAVVPGRYDPGMGDADVAAAVAEVGYPALLKPAAGGGGKGMRVLRVDDDVPAAIAAARREAAASFGDDTLMVERYVAAPRHIEVQVLGDAHGTVIALADRECSLQRRHQKVIEEAPAILPAEVRAAMQADAVRVAERCGYTGAGTVEFIVDGADARAYYFLEMNTRLQVEHPVTEQVFGLDLVEQQIRIAAGEPLGAAVQAARPTGHAIEARLYAEDPAAGFLPTGGPVLLLRPATGGGVRFDSGVATGDEVSTLYDPMIGKLIATGTDRGEALARLVAALQDTALLGLRTNQGFLLDLLAHPDVVAGRIDTTWIERTPQIVAAVDTPQYVLLAAVMERLLQLARVAGDEPWHRVDGWRMGQAAWAGWRMVGPDGNQRDVFVRGTPQAAEIRIADGPSALDGIGEPRTASVRSRGLSEGARELSLTVDGVTRHLVVVATPTGVWIGHDGRSWFVRETPRLVAERHGDTGGALAPVRSPMPGTVIAVAVAAGDGVLAGQALVTVEAMKMEHTLRAAAEAVVGTVRVAVGDRVALDDVLVTFEAAAP